MITIILNCGLLVISAFLVVGCGEKHYQTVDVVAAGNETFAIISDRTAETFLLGDSAFFGDGKITSAARRGRVIAAVPADIFMRRLALIFADGAVFSVADINEQLITHAPPRNDLRLLAAAGNAAGIFALALDTSDQLALYQLTAIPGEPDFHWQKLIVELPFADASTTQLHCAMLRDQLLIAWRPGVRTGDETTKIFSGWQAAALNIETVKWEFLPPPPLPSTTGMFAVSSFADGILLAQEADRRIYLALYNDQRWEQVALTQFPQNVFTLSPLQLTIAGAADGFTLARSGVDGVNLIRAPHFPHDPGRVIATPLAQSGYSTTGKVFSIFAWIIFGLLAIPLFFRWRSRSRQTPRPMDSQDGDEKKLPMEIEAATQHINGIASVSRRAMAMFIDGTICAFVPAGYLFFTANFDRVPSSGISFLWLGTLIIYCTLAEMFWRRTPGKALLKIRVAALEGEAQVLPKQIIIRNALRFIDFFPIAIGGINIWCLVAAVFVLTTRARQRLGDIVANTVVVNHQPLRQREIILASGSPQRAELLTRMGLKFSVVPPQIDENNLPPNLSPAETATFLAEKKGDALTNENTAAALIIAADTLVALDNKILGKPKDENEARTMLRQLSGKKHQVITALLLIDNVEQMVAGDCVWTEVHWRELSDSEIEEYIQSDEWRGRAGGYAIQGEARKFTTAIYGSLSNAIGLPMESLRELFEEAEAF